MHQDLPLFTTLAISLSAAFLGGLVARKLGFSAIVGYLIAGVLVGPYTPGLVADINIAEELASVGIVLLMFGVGLHYSLRDLLEVRQVAVPGALVQMAVTTMLGIFIALSWGWPVESGVLLGLALSVASTVVMLRKLKVAHALTSPSGRIAVGWLVVQDLAVVIVLVLIPVLAGSVAGNGDAAASGNWLLAVSQAITKVFLFVFVMLVLGKRVLPWLFRIVSNVGSRELFTLSVFAVAIGVAFAGAKMFHISVALCAFFAGMMIRESDFCKEVGEAAQPFQDVFTVLFFVSVGMLFNPHILVEEPLRVAVIVATIMIGNGLVAFSIVLLFRYPVHTALLVSVSLAQIGEFSFILANLGRSYGLLSVEGYNLILAAALMTILLNPMLFSLARRITALVRFDGEPVALDRRLVKRS